MATHSRLVRPWVLLALGGLVAVACTATPTPIPTGSPSPTATQTAVPTPTGSAIPSLPISSTCLLQANGAATEQQAVHIRDIGTQTYPRYDILIFDFDRGLPEYTITHAEPPFTADPSDLPLTVNGSYFFSIVFQGASIYDEEFQAVYEGPTILEPGLPRIEHVVMAGDFEAVSSWIVGLRGPACLAVEAFEGNRLVIAFVEETP